MSGHRANIINGTEGFMLNHFTKHHNVTDMVIKPIDICDSKVLHEREQFWIQELNTIFPYGLNSRIDIEDIHDSYNHIKNNNTKPIYKAFNTVKNNRTKRGSGKQDEGTISHNHKNLNPADVITSIINNDDSYSIAKDCRKLVMSIKIKEVHTLFIYLIKLMLKDRQNYQYNEYLLYVVKDLCLYRMYKLQSKTNIHTNYITMEYVNGFINHINFNDILHSADSCNSFPGKKQDILQTGTTYKYSPIRFKVTNYKNSVNNINWNTKCFCAEYEQFRDAHYGHVITGNLNIIKNHDIKELLKKGLNFRIKQPYNKSKAFSSIRSR